MKLYQIAKWNEIYENNRSRQVKDLSWVPIQNKMDGENFTQIMGHPKGAMIFAGFILMVELASRCTPRGCLVRGNGQPHDVRTMSAKCRCPDVWFSTAIDYLIANTDWLEVSEVAVAQEEASRRQEPDAKVTSSCQAGDEEGKGKNGTEQKEKKGSGEPFVPECLRTNEFESAWKDYIDYRRERKLKPLLPMSINLQFKEFSEWGVDLSIQAIRHTIKNAYQGIFAPNGKTTRTNPVGTTTRNVGHNANLDYSKIPERHRSRQTSDGTAGGTSEG